MKKIVFCLMAAFLSVTFIPLQSNAAKLSEPTSIEAPKIAEIQALELRLDEIKAMDKSDLNSAEKKVLRQEVKSIKKELNTLDGGGLYISAGAIIIIIILLIILL